MDTGKDVFPPMVYEGNEKYIFVSYAHKDAPIVLPIVETLGKEGFRVWYDSGIEAGTEWPEYIEDHLARAEVVLIFMSPAAVESRNCRNEINFALELKKEVLVVYLEETTLLKGMRLQLNSSQSLFREHHQNNETFTRALVNARILQCCRNNYADTSVPPAVNPAPQQAPAVPVAKTDKPKSKMLPWVLAIGALLVLAAVLIYIIGFRGNKNEPNIPDTGTQTPVLTQPKETEPAVIEMSDDLFDYTINIEGTVFQIPFKYQDITAAGWTISSSGVSDSTKIAGMNYEYFTMSNNGKSIWVYSYNASGNAREIKDCLIGGVEFSAKNDLDISIAKGITASSTVEEIIEAFGIPANRNDYDDYSYLTYQQNDSIYNNVKFCVYSKEEDLTYNNITIKNFIETEGDATETNTEVPEYLATYQVPTELSADITSSVIKVGGDLYQLPAPVSAFLNNGWSIVSQPGAVASGNTDYLEIQRDGVAIDLSIMNLADYQTTPENCAVFKVNIKLDDGVDMEIAGGLKFGSAKAEVEAAVNEDFSVYTGTTYTSWSYSEYKNRDYWLEIYVDPETNQVFRFSVSCKTWNY